jgi:hypothetical protein
MDECSRRNGELPGALTPQRHSGAQFGTRWPAEPGPVPKTPPHEPCLFESLKPVGIRIRVSACPLTRRQKHQPYIDVRTRHLKVAQTAPESASGEEGCDGQEGQPVHAAPVRGVGQQTLSLTAC